MGRWDTGTGREGTLGRWDGAGDKKGGGGRLGMDKRGGEKAESGGVGWMVRWKYEKGWNHK